MSDKKTVNIKQRIVGAIVLVSLGIIIIPLLLNGGSNSKYAIFKTHIPAKPKSLNRELSAVPAVKKMPAAKVISSKPVFNNSQSPPREQQKKSTIQSTKTTVDNKYKRLDKPTSSEIKIAYTLQVASFSIKTNAISLRDKLRSKGFKAYSESIQTVKGKVYRLRVGPYLKYDQISSVKKKIEKQFKLSNTVIIKYKT